MFPRENVMIQIFSAIAEVKRILAAIESALGNGPGVSILFTSAMPGEGKSVVTAGIALHSARTRSGRVLLLDLNWHRPCLHRFFGLERNFRLAELSSDRPLKDLVQAVPGENMDVLTAPAEILSADEDGLKADAFGRRILSEANGQYALVLGDTASVFPTNRRMLDPVTISGGAHGVVLVVLANVTPRQKVKGASTVLQTAGARLIGVVVNQWRNPLGSGR